MYNVRRVWKSSYLRRGHTLRKKGILERVLSLIWNPIGKGYNGSLYIYIFKNLKGTACKLKKYSKAESKTVPYDSSFETIWENFKSSTCGTF